MPSLINSFYEFGEFRLDPQNRVLRRGEEPVPLTPKAFEVLVFLIQHSGRVASKDELMKAVWADSFVEESNLTQTIFMLRKALGESPEQRYILTVQGIGYRFAPELKVVSENGHAGVELPVSTLPSAGSAPAQTEPNRGKKSQLILAGALIGVLIGVSIAYLLWSARAKESQPSDGRLIMAVLPFQNLTGDSTQEYFSDGLTEEMITQLGNLDPQHLGVIARTSVMHYKNSQTPLDQIGRELGVQYVLEGSVRRDSDTVRITGQLIQMKDQSHVWAREYDREPKSLLVVQGEIAREIADEIQLKLNPSDKRAVAGVHTPLLSPAALEAYDLYLKGQYFWNKRTPEGLQQAIDYFQQAIRKDPSDARAYAGLADSYALISGYNSSVPPKDVMPKAHEAAVRALELDDRLAEAHTALAVTAQNYDWNWKTAEREYQRAIALNPNYATAHHWYGEYLAFQGRFDEAFREMERARQLDPLSLIIAADNCVIHYYARQYDRAINQCRAVLQMEPNFPRAHSVIGAYVEKGLYADAVADAHQWQRMRREDAAWTWAWLAYVYGRCGQKTRARQALEKLKHLSQHSKVDPNTLLLAYVGMGKKDDALSYLEEAYVAHSTSLASLKVDPPYDPLRSEPRFQKVLRRMGLAQ